MPTVSLTISDTNQSVFRPVVLSVIDELKAATRIDKSVPVFIVNAAGQLQSAGGTLDDKGDRDARMETVKRITITPEEDYAEDQHLTDIYGTRNSVPFFSDKALNIEIRPAYATSTVTLTFRYETRSEEETRRWRNDASMKYIQNRTSFMHTLKYCYTAPQAAWELIKEVWSKREAVAGYGDNLRTYLNKCTTNALTVIGDNAGENIQLALTENQSLVQGFFDFTTTPEKPEFNSDTGMWSINFKYNFTYQRPIAVELQYPIMVHNQILSKPFIDFIHTQFKYEDIDPHRTLFLDSVEQLESNNALNAIKPLVPFIKLPFQDDTILSGCFPYTGSILHVMLTQEQADNKFAFNLKDLGDIQLDPDVLEFIQKEEVSYLGYPGKSIFHLEAFRDGVPMTPRSAYIDKDLNVFLTQDIDLRKIYHVRLAVFTDINYISKESIDRLAKYPKAFMKVIGAINQLLLVQPEFQKLGDQPRIPEYKLTRVWDILTGGDSTNGFNRPNPSGKPISHKTSSWVGKKDWLSEIPEDLIKWWRANRKGHMTVQIMYVSASYSRWLRHQELLKRSLLTKRQ